MMRILTIVIALIAIGSCFGASISRAREVSNLTAFTRLWGYAKHFYPGDEAFAMDWDRLAVFGMKEVLKCENDRELRLKLEEIFTPIIPEIKLYYGKPAKPKPYEPDPTMMKAFWQYHGYENGEYSPLFRSIRTNRPLNISPNDKIPYFWTWICPQIAEGYQHYDSLEVSYTLVQSGFQPDSLSFSAGFGGDIATEDFIVRDTTTKSYILRKKAGRESALWSYFAGFETILIESIEVRASQDGAWIVLYQKDFSGDQPGALPEKLSVNMNPEMGVLSSKVNVLVDRFGDKHVLRISKADPSQAYSLGFLDKIFAEELPWGEMLDKELVNGLRVSFPMVLPCDMEHTYPVADTTRLNALNQRIADIDLKDRTDQGVWFAGIAKIWNTLAFFYPYFEYQICDWDKELRKALKQILMAKDFIAYKLELARLLSHTQDGHSYIYDEQANPLSLGFSALHVNGQWIVGKNLNPELDIPVGSEITHFNGVPFKKLMDKYRSIYTMSNPVSTDSWLLGNFTKTYSDSLATFRFVTPNKEKTTRVVRLGDYSSYDLKNRDEKFILYPEGNVYLNLFRLTDADIEAMMPDLISAKGIILDLRFYPRVSTHLLTLLLNEQDTWSSCITKRFIRPGEELPRIGEDDPVWGLMPEEPHLKAKIIALSSRISQSYCEGYLGVIKYNKIGLLIGQPSAGSNGNVVTTNLPGDITVNWTGLFVQNPLKKRFFGVGISPDIYVERSREDVIQGIDPELNKALEILRLVIAGE